MKHLPTAVASFHTPTAHTITHTRLSRRAGSKRHEDKERVRGEREEQLDYWAPPAVSTMPLGLVQLS